MGRGFVGNAVARWFSSKQYIVKSYDKFKKYDSFEDNLESDFMFLCLPTLYSNELRGYDYSALHEVLKKLDSSNYKGVVIIKVIKLFLIHSNKLLIQN